MKYTKKQRREIYLKAAEMIEKGELDYCCSAIARTLNYKTLSLMPLDEFLLFSPYKSRYVWFGDAIKGRRARITCLLLCAEMCKD